MNILFKIVLILTLSMPIASGSPEMELQEVLGQLEELQIKARTSNIQADSTPLAPYLKTGLDSLEKAKYNYSQQEYTAVIRNLNYYLNTIQKPNEENYLDSQYLLGSSYQALKQSRKAMRAYNRYIAAYITAKEKTNPHLIAAIQNLLLLTNDLNRNERQKIRDLISALSSINLPPTEMSRVTFYLALTSNKMQDDYFAERLFKSSIELKKDPRIKAENLYFSAQIPFRKGRYKEAKERFETILSISDPSVQQYRNFSFLNIARIEAYQKNFQTALSYYNRVSESSKAYEDALFEKVFVYYRLNNVDQALVSVKEYLSKYKTPDMKERLTHLKSYLTMKSGQVKPAESDITNRMGHISSFEKWLKKSLENKEIITRRDITEISNRGTVVTNPPITLDISENLFSRISQLQSRIDNIRSEIRSTLYTLGQMPPSSYNSEWLRRSEQMGLLSSEIFHLSDRILSIERRTFAKHINSRIGIQLDRSKQRRQVMKEQYKSFVYHRGRWQSWVTLAQMTVNLEALHNKLMKLNSKTRGMKYQYRKSQHGDLLDDMIYRGEKLSASINRALEIIRSRSIRDMANQSHHTGVYKYILDYSQLTYQESMLLKSIRDQYSSPSEQHLSRDIRLAWQKWEYTLKMLFNNNRDLDKEMRRYLGSQLNDLDQYIKGLNEKHDSLSKLREGLEKTLGQDIGTILSHYQTAIDKNNSELMKWKADNQWVSYLKTSKERSIEEQKQEQIETKLEEDLQDLEYEVR